MIPIMNAQTAKESSEEKPVTQFNIEDDGVTHINIWLHGKTELGRMLSHFYEEVFKHPYYGDFRTMEGLWRYIQNKPTTEEEESRGLARDKLRYMSGIAAKNLGKSLKWQRLNNFREIIAAANFYKIEQNPKLMKLFTDSTLPFAMYYFHTATGDAAGQGGTCVSLPNYAWLVKSFEDNRTLMQYGERPNFIDYQNSTAIEEPEVE
jgi:hypothetical protein